MYGGEAGDRLLSLQVPCHLCDPPGTRRAGGPQPLLHEGLRGPTEKCSRTAKRGPKTTEKCSRTAERGPKTASLGLRCRCSRDGLRGQDCARMPSSGPRTKPPPPLGHPRLKENPQLHRERLKQRKQLEKGRAQHQANPCSTRCPPFPPSPPPLSPCSRSPFPGRV